MFTKAQQKKSPLRLLIYGASGCGKTYSSLLIARTISNDWGNVYVIDTERSANKLATDTRNFNIFELNELHPDSFINSIKNCQSIPAGSFLIIDSMSHFWAALQSYQTDLAETVYAKNTMGSWGLVTKKQIAFFDALRLLPCHVIMTCRTKEKMVQEEGSRKLIKLPDQPDFRGGVLDYESDIAIMMLPDHKAVVWKDRSGLLPDGEFLVDGNFTNTVHQWSLVGSETNMNIPADKASTLGPIVVEDNDTDLKTDYEDLLRLALKEGKINQDQYAKGASIGGRGLQRAFEKLKTLW